MFAGVSYTQAKRALFGEKYKGSFYTQTHQMKKAPAQFGVVLSDRLVRCVDPERFDHDALVRTNELANGNWHWVGWDAKRRKTLDPLRYKRGLRPISCLVVLNRTLNSG